MLKLLRSDVISIHRKVCTLLILLFSLINLSSVFADGSKDLYPNGTTGNRAFLVSYDKGGVGPTYFPFRTPGTHYVYAKGNEVITMASSAQGLTNWFIRITSPRGAVTTTTAGKIATRKEELAGPRYVGQVGGNYYVPHSITVLAVDEGVWKIEFVSSNTSENADNVLANDPWSQINATSLLSAWDISVRDATNTKWLPGRVYTNVFNLRLSNNLDKSETAYYGISYVLTKDGRAYRVKNNGNNGYAFTFFSNNKGFLDSQGNPSYKSLDNTNVVNFVKDPRKEDNETTNLVTHKLFYGPPAPDLPVSAPVSIEGVNTRTWLKNEAVVPNISGIEFKGSEGTVGQASQKGGIITFTANVAGSYRIVIPLGAGKDRVLSGAAVAGVNTIEWDGKDALNNVVPGGLIIPEVKVRLASAEVHFPFIDMEINPQGIIIELAENTTKYLINPTPAIIDESVYSDRVYWDDSNITGGLSGEKSNPQVNTLNGLSSNVNGHIWGTYSVDVAGTGGVNNGKGTNSYGNEKSMDTYAYILSKEEAKPLNVVIKVADLQIVSIIPTVAIATLNQVNYQIKVKNEGGSDVTGAKFEIKIPAGFTVTGITRSFSNIPGAENSIIQDINTYRSSLDLPANCVVTYNIVGIMDAAVAGEDLHVEASIMRPKDVTDPDATNTVFTQVPTNPHDECKNGTAIEACNNIKYNNIKRLEVCSGSAISPFVYNLVPGGTSFFVEGKPDWLSGVLSGGKVTFNGTATSVGLYLFTVGTDASDREKTTYVIKVNPLPSITSQPVSIPACEGTDAVFSVSSSGATFQWQYEEAGVWKNFVDGADISGATTTALKISAISLAYHGKKIRVDISSTSGCSTKSSEITLVVNARPAEPPYIYGSENLCKGGSVLLTSSLSDDGGYQWFYNGGIITGATARTYSASKGGTYTVAVSNTLGCFSKGSDAFDVKVVELPAVPKITYDDLTVCEGSTVKLTSDEATTYQWYRGGAAINGATSRDYIASASGNYSVLVTNAGGCPESSVRVSVVISSLPVKPGITAGSTTTFCIGDQVILTSDAATGNQWYLNGAAISGAIGQTYTVTASGKYTVITTNGNGCASPVSNEIEVTVNPLPVAPVITAGTTTVFCTGGEVILSSDVATGNQWYLNGAAISGATGQTYTATASGKYTVITTNGNGCASPVSNEIEVTVNPLPVAPVITAGTTTVFCTGGEVILSSDVATGNQWYLNGAAISGATGQTYTVTASGKYTVMTTNGNGCASSVSNEIEVTVNPLPVAPVITAGTTTVFCAGGEVILSSDVATGNQWYLNGAAISGATGQTYTVTASGKYTVITTNGNGCASPVSNEIEVAVNPLPVAPVITAGSTTTFCIGDQVILTSDAATGNQWYLNGAAISGATGQTYTVTASGKYTVITTNGNGCASPVSNEIEVTVNPLPVAPVITAGSTTTFCIGDQVILTSDASTGNQWYINGAAISGATGQTYTVTASGKYTVITTNGNGCASPVSNEIEVTVNPLPVAPVITAGSTTTFCIGDQVILTSDAATGNQWYLNGAAISGATGPTYTVTASGKYTVIMTNGNGCASPVSNEIGVTVNPLPVAPVITAGTTTVFCTGGEVILSSDVATGNQWYLNGAAISGATGQTYTATASGKYTVITTNGNGCASSVSNEIEVTVNPLPVAPVITAGSTTTFCIGDQVILTSDAAAGNQWYLNGTVISGATGQTYTVTASGKYTVITTNGNGCASPVSNEIEVTVNPLPVAPVITAGSTTTFCIGDQVILTSDASTGNQWYINGAAISGATGQTYTVTASGKYTVITTNGNGCASPVSNEIEVTVNPLPVAPVITAGSTTTFCIGDQVILTSDAATGNQWYLNGAAISGATGPTYTVTASGKYTVIMTNGNGCASPVSNEIGVTVNPLPVAPVITAGTTTVFCTGGEVILSSDVATGNQWYLNGAAISGATGQTYTVTASGKYTVIMTNGNGCASPVSNEIEVTVNPLPVAPVITAGSAITFCIGDQVILTSDASTGNQWYLNGAAISGATGPTYTVTASGKYTVITTNGNGCASPVSNEIEVTVNPLPVAPVITAGTTTVFCAGGEVILSSDVATGNQWYLNGAAISGATGQTYTVTASGKYTVITTNGNGCASPVSNEIEVTVNPLPVAPVITAGTTTVFCAGGEVILSSDVATGNQWYLNGAAISGATGQTYTATASGKYTVITTNGNGCASSVSNEIEVTVNPLPVAPVITAGTTTVFCAGGEVILSSDVATGNQWYLNGAAISGATGQTYTVTASGKYTVITTNGNGCASPVSNEIEVTVNPLPVAAVITAGTTTVFCTGGEVILSSDVATGNQWYLNGAAISGATGQTYTVTASGKYTVITTNGNGCASPVSNEIEVTVNPLPVAPAITAGSTTTFCIGDQVILTSDAVTGNQWHLNGTAISGATGQTYTVTASGKYTVITTNGNGCASPVSNEIEVTVNPLPVAPVITAGSTTTFCIGDQVILTSDASTGNQWYINGAAISGATGQTYTVTASGKYTVITTNGNGCASPVSNEIEVTVNPLPVAPAITAGSTTTFCIGDQVILTSDAVTGNQWHLNGTAISGATGQTYTVTASGKYTVITTNGNGCASPVSNEIEVTVNPLPVAPVITAGSTTTFCIGDQVILTSDASTGNQWYINGAAISGATGQTYTVTASGKYTVITTNGNGCASPVSNEIEVMVNPLPVAPVITAGSAITFCIGDQVILTSDAATGNQWYLNGAAISGATGQTFTVTASGKYTVITTNGNGCASSVSNEIEVTVNPLPVAPVITAGTTTVFCTGGEVFLTSDAVTGNQWHLNGTAISGATGQTYTVTASGKYTVITTNGNGCASPVSNEIEVTVNPLPVAPVITAGTTTVFCAGGEVILSSDVATGNQWYLNGAAISGATGPTYTVTASGKYTVITTNGNGCASPVSNEIEVTVNPLPVAPVITAGTTTVFCAGDQVILTSDAATGNQWYLNGAAISGATGQTYTATASGKYTVITTNGNGCASPVSNEIEVTVNVLPAKPGITGTEVICEGDVAVLTSGIAAGYQWYLNGVAITAATARTYNAKVAGKYTVVTSNANGCLSPVSNEITLTVNDLPTAPVITGTATICEGDVAILTSEVGAGYQWYLNGVAISGAVGRTYDAKLAGKYTVITTNINGCFSPVSNEIMLIVNALPPVPTIIVDADKLNFCVGSSVILTSSSATGNQWYKNGQIIPGATNKIYTAMASGQYTVIVTNASGCSSPVSQSVEVNAVSYPDVPEITPGGRTTFCEGRYVVLTSSSLTGNQWYKDGILIPGAVNQTFSVNQIGDYTVKVTNATGCASGISAKTIVTVNSVPKGYNDIINSLSCTQSSFSYSLQNNVDNTTKGGNAVPASFSWTANSSVVAGVTNGSGKTLNANLINTSITAQSVVYTVTPRGETGGCAGQPFNVTVYVPVCVDITISKTADRSSVSAVGDKIKYTITVHNNGNANHNQVVVNDPLLGGILSQPKGDNGNGILEKNESWIYEGIYTISQNDLDVNGFPLNGSGKIINTATVHSLEYTSPKSASADVTVLTNASITLVKTGVLNRGFKTLTYTFKITNTGNVTLSNLDLIDVKIPGPIALKQTVLGPGATLIATAEYTIAEAEKVAGTVTNTATINGFTKQGLKVTDISGTAANNDDPTIVDITRYPVAIDDFASTKAEEPVSVPIVINDRPAFFPLDVATVDVKSLPTNGTLSVAIDGKVTYKPNKGFYGVERFTYKINDANGLSSNIAEVRIDVAPPPLEIPNTFTPNGDGKNDTFLIKGLENYEGVSFFVYNRWGDEVYRNLNYKNEWDGKGLNDGTYFYVLKLKKGSAEDIRRSWVLLKR